MKTRWMWVMAGFFSFAVLSMASAWFSIQAVRWGYLNQKLASRVDELAKREQSLDRRLQQSLSLQRLDEIARGRFGLQVPAPGQVILIREES